MGLKLKTKYQAALDELKDFTSKGFGSLIKSSGSFKDVRDYKKILETLQEVLDVYQQLCGNDVKGFKITYVAIESIVDKPDFMENLLEKLNVTPLVFETIFKLNVIHEPDYASYERMIKSLDRIKKNYAISCLLYLLDLHPELIEELYRVEGINKHERT